MTHTETVQSIYAAFGRGDVNAILGKVSDHVDWDNSRVASRVCPWNGNFSGKANLPGFFTAVADHLDMPVFNPHTFVASGSHVAVVLRIEGRIKKTGKPIVNDVIHLWTFGADGKVTAYRHFNDTAMELAAWNG